jgi:hypothetical protein
MPAYTWTTGETITAAKLNALETEAWRSVNAVHFGSSTSESSTSSATFVDGLATVTFTAASTEAYIQICTGPAKFTNSNNGVEAGFSIDGTDYDVVFGYFTTTVGIDQVTMSGGRLVTGLTAGNSYTATIRFRRVSASANTVYINRGGTSPTVQSITVFEINK